MIPGLLETKRFSASFFNIHRMASRVCKWGHTPICGQEILTCQVGKSYPFEGYGRKDAWVGLVAKKRAGMGDTEMDDLRA
ncbi:MAG: hypothetical protein BBJ60_01520 [Desulfobacterales bacterium S7086C20]|nr:MAG: hypothetical protein BBJ60_01520 [Desulfobacterales bacterium S7086C20]